MSSVAAVCDAGCRECDLCVQTGGVLVSAAETARVGYRSAVLMSVVVIGLFWTVFVYDMMADVYGSFVGGLVVLAPMAGGLAVYGVLSLPAFAAKSRVHFLGGVELLTMSNPVLKDSLDLNSAL